MALKQTKPGIKVVGGAFPNHKLQDQFLNLQTQKNDSKELNEFVVEMLARHDEIMNQNLEKFRQEMIDMVQQKYDSLKQYILKALTGLSQIIIKEDKK